MEIPDNHLLAEETDDLYTVSEISDAIRQALESEFPAVRVLGEITNFTAHSSGHFYLTLRDPSSRLGVVVFSRNTANMDFAPEDGMTAVASGRISHYGAGGRTQLIATSLRRAGEGEFELARRRLLAKLMEEGLTDPGRKRDLPAYPERIAVVTSPEGAAVRDIRRTLARRWPLAEVLLVPAAVQGETAAASIVGAFKEIGRMDEIDIVILARGGGSSEDLWTFNKEPVARAVAGCGRPVVTGIGHEIDWTVCDFVSDVRGATPTAAAELAVPDSGEVRVSIGVAGERLAELCREGARRRLERVEFIMRSSAFPALENSVDRWRLEAADRLGRLDGWKYALVESESTAIESLGSRLGAVMREIAGGTGKKISALSERLAGRSPSGSIDAGRERLAKLEMSVRLTSGGKLQSRRSDLDGKVRTLKGLGPREVLGRGYTYCTDGSGGRIIGSVDELTEGEGISVNFFDGEAGCRVESRRKDARWRQKSHSKTR